MNPKFAIAVEWPSDSKPFLVHLEKPYFVAEVRQTGGVVYFLTTLSSRQLAAFQGSLQKLLTEAAEFFSNAMGIAVCQAHFIKGNHGHDFPQYLMARSEAGDTFIVEPDHSAPLVEVKDQTHQSAAARAKAGGRFDVVTQWRLAQMRKYYQQFLERQQHGAEPQALAVPQLPTT